MFSISGMFSEGLFFRKIIGSLNCELSFFQKIKSSHELQGAVFSKIHGFA